MRASEGTLANNVVVVVVKVCFVRWIETLGGIGQEQERKKTLIAVW